MDQEPQPWSQYNSHPASPTNFDSKVRRDLHHMLEMESMQSDISYDKSLLGFRYETTGEYNDKFH